MENKANARTTSKKMKWKRKDGEKHKFMISDRKGAKEKEPATRRWQGALGQKLRRRSSAQKKEEGGTH